MLENKNLIKNFDVVIINGQANTAHSGGEYWDKPELVTMFNEYVHNGGAFIGVGQPSAYQKEGKFFQLSNLMGVEEETGFTLGDSKFNWEIKDHFILEDVEDNVDFGEGMSNIYASDSADILAVDNESVQMAVNEFGDGRSVYLSGLPFSFENARVLLRAILWATNSEDKLLNWYSSNVNVDVHAYVENDKYCVVNNTFESQDTKIYTQNGESFDLSLEANEIKWFVIE